MNAIGIIPARWGSTRFPGKSLAPVCGKPLVQWVVESALRSRRLDTVIVATDDARIAEAVRPLGVEAVMTRADHPSGTDRVAEVAARRRASVVVNLQGDEPLLDPGLVDRLVDALTNTRAWDMATAASRIEDVSLLANPSVVKVVWNARGQALYFSRCPIPFARDGLAADRPAIHWRHLGIYAYRKPFLLKFVSVKPCALEQIEKLEQLRALDMGGRIRVLQVSDAGVGVDTPEDVPRVEAILRNRRERSR